LKRYSASALLLVFLLACQRAPAQSGSGTDAPAPAAAAQAAVAPVASDQQTGNAQGGPAAGAQAPAANPVPTVLPEVLARVNGEPIGRAEFEQAIKTLEAQAGGTVPPDRRDEIFRGVLDQLVTMHLLVQDSVAHKISVPEADVDARLGEIQQQFPSQAEFEKVLASRSLTTEQLRNEIRRELTLARLIEIEVAPQVRVQEGDIKAFYDQNPEQFQQAESVRASHILIGLAPGATDAQKGEARAKADSILAQVTAGGDFAALAREHSEDGSASQGGDLNFFTRGQMVPPFEAAAFALQPGQTSGVVETQFGLHIIRLTERRPAQTVPLAAVSQKIGEYLAQQQQGQKMAAYIDTLKARSKIEILI
jgi:peptidyl-prolyl cis-trans isomerase C